MGELFAKLMDELGSGERLKRIEARRLVRQWLKERNWQEQFAVSVRGRVVSLRGGSAVCRYELRYSITSLEECLKKRLGEGWRVRLR